MSDPNGIETRFRETLPDSNVQSPDDFYVLRVVWEIHENVKVTWMFTFDSKLKTHCKLRSGRKDAEKNDQSSAESTHCFVRKTKHMEQASF